MKVVYIAHPIKGDIQGNLEKVKNIVREINLSNHDVIPFAPYWIDCHALNDNNPEERLRGIKNNIAWFEKGVINELWVYGEKVSEGMQLEINKAENLSIPVIYKSSKK
jgi:hypothetical protein